MDEEEKMESRRECVFKSDVRLASLKQEGWVRNVSCRALGLPGVTGGFCAILKQHHAILQENTRISDSLVGR